ncbi:MAG: histidine phosphatase family protein [Mesorhizobium amorphae]|nr:MAG: histidine phosphatase family protein [Mesorhizobium amorphae]
MIKAFAALAFLFLASLPASATEAGWALLRAGGHAVLLNHARTAGMADPAHVDPEHCATQRPLDDRGQQQARRIGALFAARAAPTDEVVASRFCRAKDTARLAFGGTVEELAALDPVPSDPAAAETQAQAVLERIRLFDGPGNLVLVTHASTIQALTGQGAREGEAVIVRPEGERLRVLGRIVFN